MNTTDELSLAEVAILLHRTVQQIRPLAYSGRFGPIRIGGTPLQKHFFVTVAGVEAYQREYQKQPKVAK
jgi:hypothetical protein